VLGTRWSSGRKAVRDRRLQAPCIPLLELQHKHHRCFRLRDPDRQRFAAAVLNSTTFFVRPAAQRSKWRPYKLRKQFSAELWEKAGLIDMTMDMTRGDIGECASAYVMIDKARSNIGRSRAEPARPRRKAYPSGPAAAPISSIWDFRVGLTANYQND